MGEPLPQLDESGRYRVERRLGAGGMGVVYEAFDTERGTRVALKTLSRVDAGGIYRFKNEFRSLTDVSHPNLVALHELVSSGERWFFTMDLVEGMDFGRWVSPGARASAATLVMTPSGSEPESGEAGMHRQPGIAADEARLRAAMEQLARGVMALHQAGKLHRDLKPSNVMVGPDGHVTLLDFGLVAEPTASDLNRTLDEKVMGTPAYMSPEQAAGQDITPASDWYSVGAMLYEALTGVLPFHGSVVHVLAMKQLRDPPTPEALVGEVPSDLAALAMELLQREPARRPSGDEILRRLSGGRSVVPAMRSPAPRDAPSLVGREPQLATLAAALGESRGGVPVVAQVHGPSGYGKSALVWHFLERLREEGSTVVLAGRCYERESVPFKALDSVVDSLSRYLRRLRPEQAAELLPRDVQALARVFPVLRRVRAIERAPEPAALVPDAIELRRRAFRAAKELLARIGDRAPLVVFVDDLQWADADSAAMLAELLRPPDAPALLWIGAWRTEAARHNPLVRSLETLQSTVRTESIRVESLSEGECREVARALLAQEGRAEPALIDAVAKEAEGSPFFVGELVRHAIEEARPEAAPPSLSEVLRRRREWLPEGARRLLEVVALAGGPVETTVAVRAAKLDREAPSALVALRAGSWVRGQGASGDETLETYHDRIREAVQETLEGPRRRAVHRRLARAMIARGEPDAEVLALHLEGAGEGEAAGSYAADAARRAAGALAFDRAARLYRKALQLLGEEAEDRGRLEAELGDALASDGRSSEAAEAYLAAAGRPGTDALELRRRAAEHLLRSGHVDRGREAMGQVLAEVGLGLSRTPRSALGSLVVHKSMQALRGLDFEERAAGEVDPAALRRVDACWSVTMGLSMVDPIRGAEFQARHLWHALRAGEPYRVVRALALEGAHRSSTGMRAAERAGPLIDRAQALAERLEDPHALGLVKVMRASRAFFMARWQEAFDHSEEAEAILRERCTNVAWELATSTRFNLVALYYMGRFGEMVRRVPERMAWAGGLDDLYARASAGSGCAIAAWLTRDDLPAAEAIAEELRGQWSEEGFQLQHYMLLQADTHNDLYAGRHRQAWVRMVTEWPGLEGSLLLRVQILRTIMHAERASTGVAADTPASLHDAAVSCKRLAREGTPWATAMGTLLRAGLAHRQRDLDEAATLLDRAATLLDAEEGRLFAASARLHRGHLVGGDEGTRLVEAAGAVFRAEGVVDPCSMAHMLAPGFR